MKKLALLMIVVIIALCLLLYSCGKKKNTDTPQGSNSATGQVDELPNELPDFLPNPSDNPIFVGYVLRDDVNVRSSATTDSPSIGKVSRGDMLLILKSGTTTGSNGGTWYEVRYNSKNAYIHTDFLDAKEMTEDAVINIGSVINVDSVLNIRAEPNSQSEKVGRANTGDKFIVLAQGVGDGTWTKIEYAECSEGVAYLKSEYLSVVQQMLVNMLLL